MTTTILTALLAASVLTINSRDSSDFPAGFTVTEIDKTAAELSPDSVAPTSPTDYYRLRSWVGLNGRNGMWSKITTKRYGLDPNQPDVKVDSARAARLLAEKVVRVVTYRDSAAAVIVRDSPDYYLLDWTWIEDGRWVNGGQGMASDTDALNAQIIRSLPHFLATVPRINQIHTLPADVEPFSRCLAGVSQSPEEFLLSQLRTHKLVINGEYHRRRVSWDMLRRLIALPGFTETVGTVFMELPSWRQPTMDAFMASDSLDAEKLLDIFRDEQPNGWWDKGEFDFLCDVWELNRRLPEGRRVNVILTDYQIPYSRMATPDDIIEKEDRNTHMADVIERHIRSNVDSRNSLFLVGCGHACKSSVPGSASTPAGMEPALTAGAQLALRLGDENVFSVMQHAISSDNSGRNRSKVRGGIFDRAFALNGNRPVGFSLRDTPFGAEPFDGIYEMKYDYRTGTYADNFDGYLFLHSLDDEPHNPPLLEIFSPGFVAEMQRRARVLGFENHSWMWFGTSAGEMTPETIRRALTQ